MIDLSHIATYFIPIQRFRRLQFMWALRPQYENKGSNKLFRDLGDQINCVAAYLCSDGVFVIAHYLSTCELAQPFAFLIFVLFQSRMMQWKLRSCCSRKVSFRSNVSLLVFYTKERGQLRDPDWVISNHPHSHWFICWRVESHGANSHREGEETKEW